MSGEADKKHVDWELVERDYRAGIKTLRQIGEERGVSHTAIQKKAKQFGWVRDLSEKIQQKVKDKVAKQAVAKSVAKAQKLSDVETIEAYSDVIASVDLIQREDLKMAIDNSRSQLRELVGLGDPKFTDALIWLGEQYDESGPTANGGWKNDKANELYQYIISLAGRVKMSKEIAAAHGVYIPMQRKVFGLDNEKKSTGEFEEMLRQVQAEA